MDFEQDIFENIKRIDAKALYIFEQVFERKLEDERLAVGSTAMSVLAACSAQVGKPMLVDMSPENLAGRQRAGFLIETGSRAKVSKKLILEDLSMVSMCVTAALKALEAGSLNEALSLTVSASEAVGAAAADFRQLRGAQGKTGKGGRKTKEAHDSNTKGNEEKVIAAYRAMNPKPKKASDIAAKLMQDGTHVPYYRVYELVRTEMKSEKTKLLLQSTE